MYLYGASGHAKVVLDILNDCGIEVKGFIDDNPAVTSLSGMPVIHSAEGLSPVIITIGNCETRRRIAEKLQCDFATAIHPSAIISSTASIGEGSVVMQGAVVQTETRIGRHCIINTRCSIDHECSIGDFVHIAPGCILSGDVHVGEGTWIGVGSVIKQGIRIGRNCFIGAGSVVVKDIPDNTLAYGAPCKVIQKKD